MKKLITLLTSLMLFVGVFAPTVSAANPTLRAVAVTHTKIGTSFDVTLSIENNPGFNGLEISAEYDKTVLSLEKTTNGSLFKTIITTSQNKQVVPYKIMWITSDVNFMDITEDGVVVTYTFKVLDDAALGDTALRFAITDFSDNANTKDFDFVDSEIKVEITNRKVSSSSSPLPSSKPAFVYTSSLKQSLQSGSQSSSTSAGSEQTGSASVTASGTAQASSTTASTPSQSTTSLGASSQTSSGSKANASVSSALSSRDQTEAVVSAKDEDQSNISSQKTETEETEEQQKQPLSKNIKYPLLAVGMSAVIGVAIKIVAVIKKKKQ